MRAWLGVAVVAVLVTGSGTAVASASPAASGPAKAAALASHLVAEMTFPAGTKPSSLRSVPSALRDDDPFGSHSEHAERLLVAPVTPTAAWAVVLAHKPFGPSEAMGSVGNNGPVGSDALLAAPEPGISAAMASVWMEPWRDGTTLIAVYGFATWLPVRTAAEHLNPSSFRSIVVSADTIAPSTRSTTRTFTTAADISRVTTFLNARPAAPELAIPCPLPATSYQARFTPKVKGHPTVTVSSSCMTDQITVNGVAQPLVWDQQGGLAALLGSLLRPAAK
ncbi:MAG TPA: hypothetical protein VN969_17075 [Streptosporangiaceae bacterium]|nr:hypothetical protein [Streptosporangiaceae bacterium]